MSAAADEAFAHHVGKWHRREPEMALAEVFCPPEQRRRHQAWGALLFELREAVFELSDPRVSAVKTGWWAEALQALEAGQSRHPLTGPLTDCAAPWSRLARAVIETLHSESRPESPEHAIAGVQPLADAVTAVESAVFGQAAPTDAIARAVAIHWLLHRLPQGLGHDDAARIPMNLLARHNLTADQLAGGQGQAVLQDWAGELRQRLPARVPEACLFRRLRTRFDRDRLLRLMSGRGFSPAPAPWNVWQGWRAARSG